MKQFKQILFGFLMVFTLVVVSGCGQAVAEVDIGNRIDTEEKPLLTFGVKADTNLFGFYNI